MYRCKKHGNTVKQRRDKKGWFCFVGAPHNKDGIYRCELEEDD